MLITNLVGAAPTPDASPRVRGASGVPLTSLPTFRGVYSAYSEGEGSTSGTSGVIPTLVRGHTCAHTRLRLPTRVRNTPDVPDASGVPAEPTRFMITGVGA